jgi:hypothetical protein
MDLRDALKNAGASGHVIAPGDVYTVTDEEVVIPETPDEKRIFHPQGRTCVIFSNAKQCSNVFYKIVTVAPTSSRIDLKRMYDFPVTATKQNGLDKDRLAMLGHLQPIRKVDLIKKIGELSIDVWEKLIGHVLANFYR